MRWRCWRSRSVRPAARIRPGTSVAARRGRAAAGGHRDTRPRDGSRQRCPARIAFQSDRAGRNGIFTLDLASGAIQRLTAGGDDQGEHPAWAPDGRRLAFATTAFDHATYDVAVLDVADRRGAARHRRPRVRPPSGVEPRRPQRVLLQPPRRHPGGLSRPARSAGRRRRGVVPARARLDARRGARRPADRLRPRFGAGTCGSWSHDLRQRRHRGDQPGRAWTPPMCAGRRTDRGSPSRAWPAPAPRSTSSTPTGGGWRSLGLPGAQAATTRLVAGRSLDRGGGRRRSQRRLGSGADRHRRAGPRPSAHVRAVGGPRPVVASGRMSARRPGGRAPRRCRPRSSARCSSTSSPAPSACRSPTTRRRRSIGTSRAGRPPCSTSRPPGTIC